VALYIELSPDESIRIGDHTTITVEKKTGQRTRLRVKSAQRVRKIDQDSAPSETMMKAPEVKQPEPAAGFFRRPVFA
jgi:hypothetical protein